MKINFKILSMMSLIALFGATLVSAQSCVTDNYGNVLFCPNGAQVASVSNALGSNAISQIGLASNTTGLLGLVVELVVGALGIIILIRILTPVLQILFR